MIKSEIVDQLWDESMKMSFTFTNRYAFAKKIEMFINRKMRCKYKR